MVFPTVENFSSDAYALSYLGQLLSDGKDAPLYKVIVEERELAPSASAFQQSLEVAGAFNIRVRTFPQISLADVETAIQDAFALFEEEGFTEEDLDRIKAQSETAFYNGISSILNKAFQLARYNEFAGSPGYIEQDAAAILAVTTEDIWRVYEQYIKDRPFVLTSWVPRGQGDLVAEGSERFVIPEESIETAGAGLGEQEVVAEAVAEIPSSFDRSVEPARGPAPEVTIPQVWTHTYSNGLRLYGIEHHELPLVQFSLTINGGNLLDDMDKVGVANLMTDIMMEGTANRTPLELEEAIDALGANISMFTSRQAISLRANGLKSMAGEIYSLFAEILLEPRWDENELPRLKDETVETINRSLVSPAGVASSVFSKLVYGPDNILGQSTLGTAASVESIEMDDLRAFYEANYSPSVSYLTVAGDLTQAEAIELFRPLEEGWAAKDVPAPTYPEPTPHDATSLYFVDIPGARQSQIYVGHLGLPRTHPDHFALSVMNYQLSPTAPAPASVVACIQGRSVPHLESSPTPPGNRWRSSGMRSRATGKESRRRHWPTRRTRWPSRTRGASRPWALSW
jgi:zinc protease